MALVVIALVVVCNSPTLDVQRISVNSQLSRLANGRVSAANFDLQMLRRDSGRQGYAALLQLADSKAAHTHPAFAKRIGQAVAHGGQSGFLTRSQRKSQIITNAGELREHLTVVAGNPTPDASFYTHLLADQADAAGCLSRSSDCVLASRDLDRDGSNDQLLCNLGSGTLVCAVYQRDNQNHWHRAGRYPWWKTNAAKHAAAAQALRQGQIQVITPKWARLEIGGSSASFDASRP